MTKVVLHGGGTSISSQSNKDFYQEVLTHPKDSLHILLIYNANPQEQWKKKQAQDVKEFTEAAKKMHKTITYSTPDTSSAVVKEIAQADCIYIRGGRQIIALRDYLQSIPNLSNLIQEKTVAGSSAGAYALSRYFLSRSLGIQQGSNIFPFKVSTHYREEMAEDLSTLKSYKEELPTFAIPEEQFEVHYF